MKIKVEKEVSLGELLHELLSKRGIRVLSSDYHDRQTEVGADGLTLVAKDFYDAVRTSILREGNQR